MGKRGNFTSSPRLDRRTFAARPQDSVRCKLLHQNTQNTQRSRKCYWRVFDHVCMHCVIEVGTPRNPNQLKEIIMKIWNKPQVREQAVGMEVTAYLPADIDLI